MLIGHYGPALALRAHAPQVPLWVLFALVQAADIAFFAFSIVGIEDLDVLDHRGPLALGLHHIPYTHSIVLTAAYLGLVLAIGAAVGHARTAVIVTAAIASHWMCDLLVHVHDLPVTHSGEDRLGFGWWHPPLLGLVIELATLALGTAWLLRSRREPVGRLRLIGFVAVLGIAQVVYVILPPLRPAWLMAIAAECLYVLIAAGAWFIEGRVARDARLAAARA